MKKIIIIFFCSFLLIGCNPVLYVKKHPYRSVLHIATCGLTYLYEKQDEAFAEYFNNSPVLSSPATYYPNDVSVSGYYTNKGTYVPSYHRSSPDGLKFNNDSTKGNVNPWTGKKGTK
jgi:hypothetical protein